MRRIGRIAACVEHALEHSGNHGDDGYALVINGGVDGDRIETLVQHHWDTVNRATQQDGESADMEERQYGQPAVIGVQAKVEGRGGSAPPVIAVAEHSPLGRAGGAGGVDDGVGRFKID